MGLAGEKVLDQTRTGQSLPVINLALSQRGLGRGGHLLQPHRLPHHEADPTLDRLRPRSPPDCTSGAVSASKLLGRRPVLRVLQTECEAHVPLGPKKEKYPDQINGEKDQKQV